MNFLDHIQLYLFLPGAVLFVLFIVAALNRDKILLKLTGNKKVKEYIVIKSIKVNDENTVDGQKTFCLISIAHLKPIQKNYKIPFIEGENIKIGDKILISYDPLNYHDSHVVLKDGKPIIRSDVENGQFEL